MQFQCNLCSSNDTKFLFYKNNFQIRKCKNCKVVFTVIPMDFDLNSLYNEDYFQGKVKDGYNDYKGSESVLRAEFSKDVELLTKYTNKHSTLLEIGSAYGFFLDTVNGRYIADGLEIAADAVIFSRMRGHTVYQGTLDSEAVSKLGKRDIVCMFDVIEHLPNPAETIFLIDTILSEGGFLLLTTGNIESITAKVLGKKWRLMTPPQHAFFYSKKSLQFLLKAHNFEIVYMDTPSKFVPVGLFFYQLYRMTGIRLKLFEKMTNRYLRLNLFDTVRVLAKKRA